MGTHYLDNPRLEALIVEYRNSRQPKRKKPSTMSMEAIRTELTEMFYILSHNIIGAFKFNLDYDDLLQEGVMICWLKMDHFDPDFINAKGQKSKAFNYFTTCIYNHYKHMYRGTKHQKKLLEKFFLFQQSKLNPNSRSKIVFPFSDDEQ